MNWVFNWTIDTIYICTYCFIKLKLRLFNLIRKCIYTNQCHVYLHSYILYYIVLFVKSSNIFEEMHYIYTFGNVLKAVLLAYN
jgi:hypothetical protein